MIQKINGYREMEKLERVLSRSIMDSKEVLKKVDEILEEVRLKGDASVLEYTHMFDGHNLDDLKVSKSEIENAKKNINIDLKNAMKNSIQNITRFHERQIDDGFIAKEKDGVILGQITNPIARIGIYIPGGTASYPSTVMMNVIPAKIAGVGEIAITTPADKCGKIRDSVLVAADLLGVREIYKVGGAQAIGALCYGTESIPKVDKIVGPGNDYVAMAKRQVSGIVGIDMIAGPSEVVILADKTANPRFIAADLIAQAEHDVRAASIVVTDCGDLGDRIPKELEAQLKTLERSEIIRKSLKNYGAIIITENIEEGFDIVNRLAPEHLEILTENALNDYKKVKSAGAIFLGEYTPEAVGDYYAGPNHTLPTSRTARFSSALGVYDFVKKTSLIHYSKRALVSASKDIILLADEEALTGHANSIKVRTGGANV